MLLALQQNLDPLENSGYRKLSPKSEERHMPPREMDHDDLFTQDRCQRPNRPGKNSAKSFNELQKIG